MKSGVLVRMRVGRFRGQQAVVSRVGRRWVYVQLVRRRKTDTPISTLFKFEKSEIGELYGAADFQLNLDGATIAPSPPPPPSGCPL